MKNSLKYLSFIVVIIISIVACETDFDEVGVNLVDNNVFDTEKAIFEVNSYTKNVLKSRVDNITLNPLGVYNTSNFGLLKANVATQLNLPSEIDYGLNPTIDEVIIDIPYNSTRDTDGDFEDGKPKFILNNIYGDQEAPFNLTVSRLETFLNQLDPIDPTRLKKYFSDKIYNKSIELYNENFTPSKNDTVYYVRRADFDTTDGGETVMDFDTIKKSDLTPSIKLPLNNDFFTTNFINNSTGDEFDTQDKFNIFFNGLFFESEGSNGSMLMLNFNAANLTIYYSNDVLTDETTITGDLNDNGTTDDVDVPVRTKQTLTFGFFGIRANSFERNYAGSFAESALDNINENKKLYIQGAQGSIVSLDAFANMDINAIREENWLINEANLVLNIDQNLSSEEVPNRLFLYKLDDNNDAINEDAQILDILTEGEIALDGYLQNEDDDNDEETTEDPLKYRFRITDYISEILKNEDPTQPVKFGIKVFHTTDLPNVQIPGDTIVKEFSFDPRGVVIYGNDYIPSDSDYSKRLKLEIFYTKLNE